jgi:predicted metalloprotease
MRWTPGKTSADIEDRRGEGGGGLGRFGGGGFRVGGGRGLGCGAILFLLVMSIIFRQNFFALLDTGAGSPGGPTIQEPASVAPEEAKTEEFISKFLLDDIQDTWTTLLQQKGERYERARLVYFRDSTQSACGHAQSATGPFYCPGDQRVFIDLAFYDELARRFGAPGDFAQAYVLAHEIGHHVQNLLGTESQVRQLQQSRPGAANQLSVAMELQADCFAGVWGHSAAQRDKLDPDDIDEGLRAATAVGDDSIQKQTQGYVVPDSFTHGSAEQRATWFRRGFESGNLDDCDTFQGGGR